MLTRRLGTVVYVVAVAGVAWIGSVTAATTADAADGPVACPPEEPVCTVTVEKPAQAGGASAGADRTPVSAAKCRIPPSMPGAGNPVPCQSPEFGWWNNGDGCYYRLLKPQPAATDPLWEGHYPDGAIYVNVCSGVPGTGGGWRWLPTPPPGFGGGVNAAVLAQRAVQLLGIRGPAIRMAPKPGSMGMVGLPVWLWTAVGPTTWGPASATASVPGLSVTATARASRIVWSMGDGHSVSCSNPGTAYTQALGAKASPTCGYLYTMSSAARPGAKFTVTATTTWAVTWVGGGQTGALAVTRSSSTQVAVGELQVLVS